MSSIWFLLLEGIELETRMMQSFTKPYDYVSGQQLSFVPCAFISLICTSTSRQACLSGGKGELQGKKSYVLWRNPLEFPSYVQSTFQCEGLYEDSASIV